MQPVMRERLARVGLGLGDLALVVREDQIGAAAVDVKALAQVAYGHHRALDVPARPPGTPWAWPRGLAWLGSLPQREIARIALALVHLDARTSEQFVEILAREPAVRREAADLEVDVAVDDVGDRLRHETLDQPDHLGDVLSRPGRHTGREHTESFHVAPLGFDVPVGHFGGGDAFLVRAANDP